MDPDVASQVQPMDLACLFGSKKTNLGLATEAVFQCGCNKTQVKSVRKAQQKKGKAVQ